MQAYCYVGTKDQENQKSTVGENHSEEKNLSKIAIQEEIFVLPPKR